jgi:chloride channel protein, CIC family
MSGIDVRLRMQRLPPLARQIGTTVILAVAAGGAAAAFQMAMNWLYRGTLVRLSHHSTATFLVGSFVTVVLTALAAGFLLEYFCREASGSGIPQLKLAYWKDFGFVPWRAVWVKFLGGVLNVGGGSSLGREGPSVHIAGGLASNLAGWLGQPKQSRRAAAAAGAAAGLAAAFNTPLAAVTFVLEEILEDLNSRFLGNILLAGVVGALVVHGLIGPQPAFILETISAPTWRAYLLIPLVAAVAAVAGSAFQHWTLWLRARRSRFSAVPAWARPGIGAVLTWCLGVSVFLWSGRLGVFSLGYDDLSDALRHDIVWQVAGVLLLTKLAATVACYGFGSAGGIFSPTLFFGGMSGALIGGLSGFVLAMSKADQVTLAVVGMSACLGAVVRAPVTGILIVFEMTHEFALVPGLMLGALVSQAVARRLTTHNFYEAVLRQDGHVLEHVIPPRDLQGWQQLPVSAVANFRPVILQSLDASHLKAVLGAHPYARFPTLLENRIAGVLIRKEAERAISEGRPPQLEPAVTCAPSRSIGELQRILVQSPGFFVIITGESEGQILAVLTLHDLLRAEIAIGDSLG